jgi:iron-sulfur cluster assembly protein
MIKVSDNAKKKVVQLMTDDGFNATTDYVRVGVKSGGCSGLSYDLKFDNKQQENDKIFEDNDVKIIVDKKSFLYLVGTYPRVFWRFKWQRDLFLTILMLTELVDVEKVFHYN